MKISKLIFKIVKVLIIIISISYIFFKLFAEYQKGLLFINLNEFGFNEVLWFFIVVLLVFANWFLESIKFKLLIKPFQKITLHHSIQGVLAGITVSIFTPKRIGEFGGRIFVLETTHRLNGIFATLLGNFSQLLVTLILGLIFFPVYGSMNAHISEVLANNSLLIPIVFTMVFLLLASYFTLSKVGIFLGRFKFFSKHNTFILFLLKYKTYELFNILLISLLRYAIFSTQFFLLLNVFGLEISYFNAIIGISQVYFFMTIIPTFALGELGVRGSISLWVFGAFTALSSGILMASIVLWVLNLALPALVGAYFLSKLKY